MQPRNMSWCLTPTILLPAVSLVPLIVLGVTTFSEERDDAKPKAGKGVSETTGKQGREPITLDDLEYGKIEVDGDGRYTPGDDLLVRQLRKVNPKHLTEALKSAKRRADGGIVSAPTSTEAVPSWQRSVHRRLVSE